MPSIMKPFVFMLSFVGLFMVTVALFSGLIASATYSEGSVKDPSKFTEIDGIQYIFWEPTDGYDIDPTDVSIVAKWGEEDKELPFWSEGYDETWGERLHVVIIRNNYAYDPNSKSPWLYYKDYISIWRTMGWWDFYYDCIPLFEGTNSVISRHDELNTSTINFKLDTGFEMFIHNDSDTPILDALTSNDHYTIGIGRTYFNESMAQTSGLNIAFKLLTLQLPNVHQLVQAIIVFPFYGCIAYMIMVTIRSFIPFLGD